MFQPIRVKTSCCDKACSCGDAGITAKGFAELVAKVDGKQDELTAGENITIEDNVISALGGNGRAQLVDFSIRGSLVYVEDIKPGVYILNVGHPGTSKWLRETYTYLINQSDINNNRVVYSNVGLFRSTEQTQAVSFKCGDCEISNSANAEFQVLEITDGLITNAGIEYESLVSLYRIDLEESE